MSALVTKEVVPCPASRGPRSPATERAFGYLVLALGLSLMVVFAKARAAEQPEPPARQPDHKQEIAEVRAGTLKEAKASWWGFNKDDSTRALQAAIDSGVDRLIVDNTGSPWVVDPIRLAGDQEIVFDDGVVVIAKQGSFKGAGDSLFTAMGVKNLTLKGRGKVFLAMHKADYQNRSLYSHSEWRNLISLKSVENVTISNLTLLSSGGDGIYVGVQPGNAMNYCANVLVDNVICENHYRQGISIISAENLRIRDSVFNYTGGTAPEAGIDFEPNDDGERLVDCVVERCHFTGNSGSGMDFALMKMRERVSTPISITVRDCQIDANRRGVRLIAANQSEKAINGTLMFTGCRISGSKDDAVYLENGGVQVTLKDCTVTNSGSNPSAAIHVNEKYAPAAKVTLEDVKIVDNYHTSPQKHETWLPQSDSVLAGDVQFTHLGTTTHLNLHSKASGFGKGFFPAAAVEIGKLKFPKGDIRRNDGADGIMPIRLPSQVKFVQWAEKGQSITIEAMGRQVGRYTQPLILRLLSPGSKELSRYTLKPDNQFQSLTFTAPQTGVYTLERVDKGPNAMAFRPTCLGNGLWLVDYGKINLVYPKGKLYFQVPAGTQTIRIAVAGSEGEKVTASLIDPQGNVVTSEKDVTTPPRLLIHERPDTSKSEIWAIELKDATEDCWIQLGVPLHPVLGLNRDALPVNH